MVGKSYEQLLDGEDMNRSSEVTCDEVLRIGCHSETRISFHY